MLQKTFMNNLEISLSVSVLIVLLLILLPVFTKKYPAKWRYWVWLILAVRLLIPLNFSYPQAPVKITQPVQNISFTVPARITTAPQPESTAEVSQPDENTVTPQTSDIPPVHTITLFEALSVVWAAGMFLFLLYQISGYFCFRRTVSRFSRPLQGEQITAVWHEIQNNMKIKKDIPIARCKFIQSPMMTGFFKPILLLPYSDFDYTELKIILCHELTHYKRKDIWYKLLMSIANAVHWFNPLVYYIRAKSNKDIEMVCDSEVVKNADMAFRKQYGQTILLAIHKQNQRQLAFSTYFYGGKKIMKERFVNIFESDKKHRGIAALCILLVTVGAAGGLVACQNAKAQDTAAQPAAVTDTSLPLSSNTQATAAVSSNTATAKDTQSSETKTTADKSPAKASSSSADIGAITQKTKEYILNGQNDKPEAEKLKWSESFLNQADMGTMYQQYLKNGGKTDDIAGFAKYLTLNAPVPSNWKELFETDLFNAYGVKVSRYEPLQGDLYQVYVKMNGSDVRYVAVNTRTGYFHG